MVKRFNKKLVEFWGELKNSMSNENDTQYPKKTCWLFVSNPDKLDEKGQA